MSNHAILIGAQLRVAPAGVSPVRPRSCSLHDATFTPARKARKPPTFDRGRCADERADALANVASQAR